MAETYRPLGGDSPSLQPSLAPSRSIESEDMTLERKRTSSSQRQPPSPPALSLSDYNSYSSALYRMPTDNRDSDHLLERQHHLTRQTSPEQQQHRLYKRRWFGLVILTLQSFAIGWGFTAPSVVAETAIEWFGITFQKLNYLSIVGNFVFLAPAPFVIWILNRSGPKWGIVVSCVLTVIGNWIIFAGTRAHSFNVNFAGVVIHSLAAPFAICAPTRYSRQWFGDNSRTLATAIPSLAYPTGAAFGAVTGPYMVKPVGSLSYDMQTLIVALVFTAVAIPAPFLPNKPPTAPSFVAAAKPLTARENITMLLRNPSFYLQLFTFSVFAGAIDTASSVTVQATAPYGFTQQQGANAIAFLIFVGLGASMVVAPILDKTKKHELVMKIFVVIVAIAYTGLPWVPQSRSVALLYIMYSIIGAFSISLEPAILEFQASHTHPVSPEFSSVICWCGCKVCSGVFTILVGNVLVSKKAEEGQPKGSLFNGLLLVAGLAWLAVVSTMFTGVWIFKRSEDSKVEGND